MTDPAVSGVETDAKRAAAAVTGATGAAEKTVSGDAQAIVTDAEKRVLTDVDAIDRDVDAADAGIQSNRVLILAVLGSIVMTVIVVMCLVH